MERSSRPVEGAAFLSILGTGAGSAIGSGLDMAILTSCGFAGTGAWIVGYEYGGAATI